MPPCDQGNAGHKQDNGNGHQQSWKEEDKIWNSYEQCVEKFKNQINHVLWNSTCKGVNLALSWVKIAQRACLPQQHHRVDGHNVAHVLVEIEVL